MGRAKKLNKRRIVEYSEDESDEEGIAIGQSKRKIRQKLQRTEKTNRRQRTRSEHRKPSVLNGNKARRQRENRRDNGEESTKWGE